MIVIFISLVAATIQMTLLLVTARILGSGSYSSYSLIVAVATFVAACCGEWLRMLVARQGGSLRRRLRTALLGGLRAWSLGIAFLLLVAAVLAMMIADATSGRAMAIAIAATGLVAAGAMLSDMAATFLRFTSTPAAYNRFVLIRVALMGGSSVGAALAGADGAGTAMSFGTAGLACGGVFVLAFWPRSAARKGLVKQLAPIGWSLASGSLGTNIAMTVSRLALGIALPAAVSGGVLLAIDLATRGTNVLGAAINTWGNRLIINAAHRNGAVGARREFGPVSAVFLTLWFSVTMFGLLVCTGIPLVTLHVSAPELYLAGTVPTLLALFCLLLRTFLCDAYLSAIEQHREVALAGVTTVIFVAIGALVVPFLRTPFAGMAAFPAAIALSLGFYLIRNGAVLWQAMDRRAMAFGVEVTVTVAIGSTLAGLSRSWLVAGAVVLVIATLDAWRLWQLYNRLVLHRRTPAETGASVESDLEATEAIGPIPSKRLPEELAQ